MRKAEDLELFGGHYKYIGPRFDHTLPPVMLLCKQMRNIISWAGEGMFFLAVDNMSQNKIPYWIDLPFGNKNEKMLYLHLKHFEEFYGTVYFRDALNILRGKQ